jgi:erythromycin esterase
MIRLSAFERDVSMAENIGWLLDREGPGGKLVVWAHNYHISRYPGAMGWKLASTYDADYLPVGFAFSTGGLNAYEGYGKGIEGPVTAPLGSLGPLTAPPPDPGSYEALLEKATAPDYYLDLRQATGGAAAWLNTSHRFRSIGAIYYASDPEFHYTPVVLPNIYDVMIFLKNITPSTLLPFRY